MIERHNKVGDFAHGFLKDFNLKKGAVASSVGHDAHNIMWIIIMRICNLL